MPISQDRSMHSVTSPSRVSKIMIKAREAKNWTRSDLAREIWGEAPQPGGTRAARGRYRITTWETGRSLPRMNILPELSRVLDVPLDDLQRARMEDERDRASVVVTSPDITAGSVPGRPDLVVMTARVIVPVSEFPRLTDTLAKAAGLITASPGSR